MGLKSGTRLGPYEILGPIGAGGMGEVYSARDPRLGRDVAVKVLPDLLSADEKALNRFEHEARALAALSHPNILAVYDVGSEHDVFYVVTELLRGETLRKRMSHSPLSVKQATEIAFSLAEGLAAAHSKGVIHRDLKPENVFLTTAGKVVILDFGLARMAPVLPQSDLSEAATTSRKTEAGVLQGTVPYMSPEQIRGSSVDARSDIFSFGCTFYEMVVGRRPFSGQSVPDIMSSILKEDPPADVLPYPLKGIILHCLEKDADRRFQSAHDLGFALHQTTAPLTATKSPSAHRNLFRIASLVIVLVAVVTAVFALMRDRGAGSSQAAGVPRINSLAVLPLKNLSGDPKQDYFADGMTEELIATLSQVESIRVISRTSVMEYKNTEKPLPAIAKELNVDGVIEGSVLYAGNRVRITAQLIDASDDRHLWAQSYERDLSDILALQSEVARSIADEIHATLTPENRRKLGTTERVNPDAYRAYLRGLDASANYDLFQAALMLEKATQIDPTFAQAYARLAQEDAFLYVARDRTEERLRKSKQAVDRAFELAPQSPETHLALGYYYYYGQKDYEQALKEFGIAQAQLPNDSQIYMAIGAVQRRQGKFAASLEATKKGQELSPRDALFPKMLGDTYSTLRQYSEADSNFDRAISLGPEGWANHLNKATNEWRWKGTAVESRAVLEKMPSGTDGDWFWVDQELYEKNYQKALDRVSSMPKDVFESWTWFLPKPLLKGMIYRAMKDSAKARASFEAARLQLDNELTARPNDHRLHAAVGLVYAGLGRKDEAIREGKLATELFPVSQDAFAGPDYVLNLTRIYTMVGEYDKAFDQMEYLLSIPAYFSTGLLQLDPCFDPLRALPRYRELIEQYPLRK